MKICFFVKTRDKSIFSRVGFYKQDLEILRHLGHEVIIINRIRDLFSARVDLYYVWWWTWAIFPVCIGILKRKKVIIYGVFSHIINDQLIDHKNRHYFHRFLMNLSLKLANKNVFQTHFELGIIKKRFYVNNPMFCPLSVDVNFYKPDLNKKKISNKIFCICWLSKENVKRKKIIELINAIYIIKEKFPNVHLYLAGKEDNALDNIKNEIKLLSLGGNITILGAITDHEKLFHFQTSDIYVQPTEVEGFGLAILEAMSSGTAIISSKCGSVPEVTRDKIHYFKDNSPVNIASKIIEVFNDNNLKNKYINRALFVAQSYSVENRLVLFRNIFNFQNENNSKL